jgi:hypothetical protein
LVVLFAERENIMLDVIAGAIGGGISVLVHAAGKAVGGRPKLAGAKKESPKENETPTPQAAAAHREHVGARAKRAGEKMQENLRGMLPQNSGRAARRAAASDIAHRAAEGVDATVPTSKERSSQGGAAQPDPGFRQQARGIATQAGNLQQRLRQHMPGRAGRAAPSAQASGIAHHASDGVDTTATAPKDLLQELSTWADAAPPKEAKARAAFATQLSRALSGAGGGHFETCCKGLSSLPNGIFAPEIKSLRLHNMQGIAHLPAAPANCGLRNMALQGAAQLKGIPMGQFTQLETLSVKGATKQMTYPDMSKAPGLTSAKFGGVQGGNLNVSGNPKLQTLHVYGDQKMQRLPDLSSCPQLTDLSFIGTKLQGDMAPLWGLPKTARVHLDSKKMGKAAREAIETKCAKFDYQGPRVFFTRKSSFLNPRRLTLGMINKQLGSRKVRLANHFLPEAVKISKTSQLGQKISQAARTLQQDPRLRIATRGLIRTNIAQSLKAAGKP